jgi:hypothetical protein
MELTSLKIDKEVAKIMYPEHYKIGQEFNSDLKKLMDNTFNKYKGKDEIVFNVVAAELTMQLARMFAITLTEPTSVMKAFSEVMLSTYREAIDHMKKEVANKRNGKA